MTFGTAVRHRLVERWSLRMSKGVLASIIFAALFPLSTLHAADTTFLVSTKYLLALPNASSPAPIIRAGADRIPDQYLVGLVDLIDRPDVPAVAAEIATAVGANVKQVWSNAVKGFSVVMSEAKAHALTRNPLVKYIEENALWHLSPSQSTYVDPRACNPTCPSVIDDRLWHLDRIDQNSASPTNAYSYCSDGTGVTVYVVDTGVNKQHNEFGPSGARIQSGYNASGDSMPADDPCMGFAVPPDPNWLPEARLYPDEIYLSGHGTAVASALAGNTVGVAKGVTIVPVKVMRCDKNSARGRISNHPYQQNQTMFARAPGGGIEALYRATNSGYTAPNDLDNWPKDPGQRVLDGEVWWQVINSDDWLNTITTVYIINGINWVVANATAGPKVVTMSVFATRTDPQVGFLENAIRSLLSANITVTASANNQNGNACDTSPARLSIGNPDPNLRNDVITAGGLMHINRPWSVDISDANPGDTEADGGGKGLELAYDRTQGVREGRWICGRGDSRICMNTVFACTGDLDKCTIDPTSPGYGNFFGGSNGGPCVTLFAPAKNLFLATLTAANGYRDARLSDHQASGTSWAAPIVAGAAARILQNNQTATPAQVRATLLSASTATLDLTTLNTYDYNGNLITDTPNNVLRLSDVGIAVHPTSTAAAVSGPTQLQVQATFSSSVTYQWYTVNSDFDLATFTNKRGAFSSTPIAATNSNTDQAPSSSTATGYWVRVSNGCGSGDSDIAVVVPRPAAPSNLIATGNGANVTITWSSGTGAEKYRVERKVAGQGWTSAGVVTAPTLSFVDTPSASGGMVVYRVFSLAGVAYLPDGSLAESVAPSNADLANVNTYEALAVPPAYTTIKGQHIVELRQAVNALCDAVGAPDEYQAADLVLASILDKVIEAADFTSLMTKINSIRTNQLIGAGAAAFTETPGIGLTVKGQHLQDLRNALQ